MADYATPLPIVSPYLAVGDDVYAKSLSPWSPDPWLDDHVMADPVAGQEVWNLQAGANGLKTTKAYLVFQNSAFRSCACNSATGVITSAGHDLVFGTRVYLRATIMPSGLTAGQAYWVEDITTDTFTLRANEDLSGGVVALGSDGTGVLFVATTYRSSSDQQIGTIPALESGMIGEGEYAAATVAAFKADPQLGTADGGLVANAAASKAKTDTIGTLKSLLRW